MIEPVCDLRYNEARHNEAAFFVLLFPEGFLFPEMFPGALRASLTAGSMVRKGAEMVALGGIAVIAANLIGRHVGVTV